MCQKRQCPKVFRDMKEADYAVLVPGRIRTVFVSGRTITPGRIRSLIRILINFAMLFFCSFLVDKMTEKALISIVNNSLKYKMLFKRSFILNSVEEKKR